MDGCRGIPYNRHFSALETLFFTFDNNLNNDGKLHFILEEWPFSDVSHGEGSTYTHARSAFEDRLCVSSYGAGWAHF